MFSKPQRQNSRAPAGGGRPAERDAARERAGQPRRQAVRPGGLRSGVGSTTRTSASSGSSCAAAASARCRSRRCSPASRSRGIIWYGGARVIADPRDAGASFVGLRSRPWCSLYEPFKKLVKTNYTIQQGIAGAERVFALSTSRPRSSTARARRRCAALREGIAFDDVWFEYEPGTPVLRDIDLRIPVGQGGRAGRHERRRQEHARPI